MGNSVVLLLIFSVPCHKGKDRGDFTKHGYVLLSPHGGVIYVNRRQLCAVLIVGAACLICLFRFQYLDGGGVGNYRMKILVLNYRFMTKLS